MHGSAFVVVVLLLRTWIEQDLDDIDLVMKQSHENDVESLQSSEEAVKLLATADSVMCSDT
mgnify:CR=1 FL=1